ncbi:hypothetical protein ACLOJK_000795 [Asimina triloba]
MKEGGDHLKGSSAASVQQWQKIFNALVEMLQSQQSQLEALAKDRQLLQERFHLQHRRWASDVHRLQDHLSLVKSSLTDAEMAFELQEARSDLLVTMKLAEAFFYKSKSERSGNDLKDLQQVVDYLSAKFSEKEDSLEKCSKERSKQKEGDRAFNTIKNSEEKRIKTLQEEIRRLKSENRKLSSQKNSEVSALLSERNFVWNQFKRMETEYTDLLKTKRIEVENSHESISKLQQNLAILQSATREKDQVISKLKADLSRHAMDAESCKNDISKLSNELESLRSSRKMVSSNPTVNSSSFDRKTESNGGKQKRHLRKTESHRLQSFDPPKSVEQANIILSNWFDGNRRISSPVESWFLKIHENRFNCRDHPVGPEKPPKLRSSPSF